MAKDIKEQPKVRRITLSFILSWIFALFFFYMAVAAVFSLQILSFIILILITLFFLPMTKTFLGKKLNIELSRTLKVVILIVLLIIYGLSLPKPAVTAVPEKKISDINKTYSLGEKIVSGDFSYIIHSSIQKDTVIVRDSEGRTGDLKATGIFIVLDVTMENLVNSTKIQASIPIKLVDDKNRLFDYNPSIMNVHPSALIPGQMQPGLSKRGEIIFDVPAGSYKAEISSNRLAFFSKEKPKYINLK
ncbi:MAG: DUF4352 domain-containing protein [Nanoarchaeota archaeon]